MPTQQGSSLAFLNGGREMGALIRAFDWANTPLGTPENWPQSLRTTVAMLLSSAFPMFLWWGDELIQFYNDAYRPSLGNQGKHPTALGQRGPDCWPEIWTTIKPLIDQVLAGGDATWSENQLIPIYRNGRIEDVYWTFSYGPVLNESNRVGGVLVICQETTGIMTKEQGRRQLLTLFEQSPVAIAFIGATDLKFRMANPVYAQLVGRTPDQLVGLSLLEALPELRGQGFDQLLKDVIATGVPYVAKEVAVEILRQNRLETIYVDLTYQPQRENDDRISGVMVVATEVTQQVLARREIEKSEAKFRTLIEEAPVATCLFVGREMRIELANEFMIGFFGKGRSIIGKPIKEVLTDVKDRFALQILDEVFSTKQPFEAKAAPAELVINGVAGTYYFDFSLKPLLNADNDVYAIMEMAVDVTQQVMAQKALEASETRYRLLSAELEEQVQVRTQQLNDTINDLSRSNDNLQQFAYIASHDLQEPLRKIQSFGDLLKSQYGSQLGEGADHVDRMQNAASRMSILIKDLLSFSRISTQQETTAPVSLNDVVHSVLTDLEIVIHETKAQVEIDSLPTVPGDQSQLGQLFQNLLSNALKFRRPDVSPVIRVNVQPVRATDLPPLVKPARQTRAYHRIDVSDNGIGFDAKYVDRIFQLFQRLHGKNQYAGTGIGLAICEKVAANHGGAITAYSQLNQGATFSLYLPADA